MKLTDEEKSMLAGDLGPGVKRSMEILVKIGESFGAEKMIKITSAHVMPKEPPELLNELTEGVTELRVPFCSQHAVMSAFDPDNWEKMDIDIEDEYIKKEKKLRDKRLSVYKRVGFYQTNTCMPMLVGNLPKKGDHVSWIGSGAQLMVNSIIGAKANRDGTVVNLASAITGRIPYMGLHLDENRYAKVLVEFKNDINIDELTYTELGAIGYYVGSIAHNRNIVINGLPKYLDIDHLKYLMAPLSTSGSVSICHIVGVTPEAPALDKALGNKKPEQKIIISKNNIKDTLLKFRADDEINMVKLGCPHCSINEIRDISRILEKKNIILDKKLWIGIPYQQYELAKKMGYTKIVEKAGGVFTSACMAIADYPLPEDVNTVATNSFKAAHYINILTNGRVKTVIKNTEECIKAISNG